MFVMHQVPIVIEPEPVHWFPEAQVACATRHMPLDFLKANFDGIVAKMPTGGGFDFGTILPQVGGSFCDAQSKAELEEFFRPRIAKFVGAPRALDQVLESIDLCTAQSAVRKPEVAAFLAKY